VRNGFCHASQPPCQPKIVLQLLPYQIFIFAAASAMFYRPQTVLQLLHNRSSAAFVISSTNPFYWFHHADYDDLTAFHHANPVSFLAYPARFGW
jgi:hypothetical protein